MTRKEAWVRFMAAALTDPNITDVGHAAGLADAALEELDERWPPGEYANVGRGPVYRAPPQEEEGVEVP